MTSRTRGAVLGRVERRALVGHGRAARLANLLGWFHYWVIRRFADRLTPGRA